MTVHLDPFATPQSGRQESAGLVVASVLLVATIAGSMGSYLVGFHVAAWLANVWSDGSATARISLWVAISPLLGFGWAVVIFAWAERGIAARRLIVSVTVLILGVAAAAFSAAGLITWSEARFGDWNLAITGITSALPCATSVLGLSVALRWIVTGMTRQLYGAAAWLATLLGFVIIVTNARGALNGFSPDAPWLGLSLSSFVVIAIFALFIMHRERRSGPTRIISDDRATASSES